LPSSAFHTDTIFSERIGTSILATLVTTLHFKYWKAAPDRLRHTIKCNNSLHSMCVPLRHLETRWGAHWTKNWRWGTALSRVLPYFNHWLIRVLKRLALLRCKADCTTIVEEALRLRVLSRAFVCMCGRRSDTLNCCSYAWIGWHKSFVAVCRLFARFLEICSGRAERSETCRQSRQRPMRRR